MSKWTIIVTRLKTLLHSLNSKIYNIRWKNYFFISRNFSSIKVFQKSFGHPWCVFFCFLLFSFQLNKYIAYSLHINPWKDCNLKGAKWKRCKSNKYPFILFLLSHTNKHYQPLQNFFFICPFHPSFHLSMSSHSWNILFLFLILIFLFFF